MNWNQLVSLMASYLPDLLRNLELLLRIFVAMILGMLIGNERKNRMKSAGMRTHALVALGSALMMVVSKYGFYDSVQGDGARLAAQVVSGVGFLGAGMIFVRHNLVSGLTIGSGMYFIGIFSALLLVLMQNVSHKMSYFSNVASTGLIRMTVANKQGSVEDIERVLISNKIEIQSVQINKSDKEKMKLEFEVVYPQKMNKPKLFCALAEREDVISISE